MNSKSILIDDSNAGLRLDKVVAQALGLGRGPVKRLFDERRVRVDGRVGVKGDVLAAGARVEVSLPEAPEDGAAVPEPSPARPLVILVETADVVVVDKPAGQASAPLRPGETGALANAL
ncbi:MAG TPA: RluA family pseudouridine synthase, partial [Polyangiaceae bacterium]|nr:RluA family pseudouridine synthase [Polyangiaceae bacterium]